MKNSARQWILTLTVAGSLGLAALPAPAKDSPALEMARQLNQAFIEVADKVSPAVVVISATHKQSGAMGQEEGDATLWDSFPPELRRFFENREWERYFDNRGGRRQHSQPAPRRAPPSMGRGSGFVISEDGYIVTNNHVVENAEQVKVRFKDRTEYDAEIVGRDKESDLAVLKIKAKNLPYVKWADSGAARVGEFAIAIGAPFDLDYSVTFGHISAKGRSFEGEFMMQGMGAYFDQDFIQTDASINPGNSGGPLVNLYGEVIGINSMIRGMNTGIGFAIPSNLAKTVTGHLIKEGKYTRSWLGISIIGLREHQEYKGLVNSVQDGVVVSAITPNSPASKSELKASDIITAVDGKPVSTSRQLKEAISMKTPGDKVALSVVRGEEKLSIKVTTAALPSEDKLGRLNDENAKGTASDYGLTVKGLTRSLAEEYRVELTDGVLITEVEADSAADRKGVKPGDIITEINHRAVSTVKQFQEALAAADPKKGVVINLLSQGTSKFVILKTSD